jgi:hypothetical protein
MKVFRQVRGKESKIVSNCFKIFQIVSKFFKVFQIVSKSFKVFQIVLKFFKVFQIVLKSGQVGVRRTPIFALSKVEQRSANKYFKNPSARKGKKGYL